MLKINEPDKIFRRWNHSLLHTVFINVKEKELKESKLRQNRPSAEEKKVAEWLNKDEGEIKAPPDILFLFLCPPDIYANMTVERRCICAGSLSDSLRGNTPLWTKNCIELSATSPFTVL